MALQTTPFRSPQAALAVQIRTLEEAIRLLRMNIDCVTGTVDLDEAIWSDVGRLAHLVDAVKRADLV